MQKKSILFFSRGRGRGHAIPDLAIVDELMQVTSHFDVSFVSYSTGAETIRASNYNLIDLRLEENDLFIKSMHEAFFKIVEQKPNVVVSHEEFPALAAAKLAGVPAILISDWFPPLQSIYAEAVGYANAVIFIGYEGIFPPPFGNRHIPILYTGPVVRKMDYSRNDRDRIRTKLNIPLDASVIVVAPGAWATERRAPIAELVFAAVNKLSFEVRIFWFSKEDYDLLKSISGGSENVLIQRDCKDIGEYLASSDVVLTKGNRGTILDAASLGVPSISLTFGLNPADEQIVSRIKSNTSFNVRAISPVFLANALENKISTHVSLRPKPLNLHLHGARDAAAALRLELDRVLA